MHRRIATVLFFALAACAADPGEGKPKAVVEDVPAKKAEAPKPAAPAAPAAAPAAPAAAGDMWAVDVSKSKIEALGAKVTAQHPVVFKEFTGKVGVSNNTIAQLEFEVKMASLEADHPKLTEHLKAPDFFDIAQFPTATFKSTEVKAGSAEAGMTHTVTGEFSIRGTTKKITFPAKVAVAGTSVDASTEFVINRKDFGIVYPGKPDDLIKDNVKMTIQLVAAKPG
jgi:polyisoprenoid-binding protein YceI